MELQTSKYKMFLEVQSYSPLLCKAFTSQAELRHQYLLPEGLDPAQCLHIFHQDHQAHRVQPSREVILNRRSALWAGWDRCLWGWTCRHLTVPSAPGEEMSLASPSLSATKWFCAFTVTFISLNGCTAYMQCSWAGFWPELFWETILTLLMGL